MATIDVNEVILDPELGGNPFTVIRRKQTVDANGLVSVTTTKIPAVGAIFPTGDQSLVRMEAYEMQSKTITIVTPFRLRGVAKDQSGVDWQPDLVDIGDGGFFIVKDVNDFTKYGAGFIQAECASTDYVAPPEPEAGDDGT